MRWAAHLSLEAMLSHVQAGEAVVLGLMSGSSLDGLDLCLARFGYGPTRPWSYQILKSRTIPYDEALQERLRRAPMAARQEGLTRTRRPSSSRMTSRSRETSKKLASSACPPAPGAVSSLELLAGAGQVIVEGRPQG